MHQGPLRQAP